MGAAHRAFVRFVARATRLYEREPGEACASTRLGLVVRRWIAWAGAGIGRYDGQVCCLSMIVGRLFTSKA